MKNGLSFFLRGGYSPEGSESVKKRYTYDIERDEIEIWCLSIVDDADDEYVLSIPRKKGAIIVSFQANYLGQIMKLQVPHFMSGRDFSISEFQSEVNALFNQKKYANVIALLDMNVKDLENVNAAIEENYDISTAEATGETE